MDCRVSWLGNGGMAFSAETGSGHLVNTDGAHEAGCRNLAPRPMELLLAGAGGYSAFFLMWGFNPKMDRQAINDCEVYLQAERATEDPKVFTKINLHFTVKGKDLDRAVKLSHEKCFSTTTMLAKTAELTYSVEIISE